MNSGVSAECETQVYVKRRRAAIRRDWCSSFRSFLRGDGYERRRRRERRGAKGERGVGEVRSTARKRREDGAATGDDLREDAQPPHRSLPRLDHR